MMVASGLSLSLLVSSSLLCPLAVLGTRVGDAHYGNSESGLFYFFSEGAITIYGKCGGLMWCAPSCCRFRD